VWLLTCHGPGGEIAFEPTHPIDEVLRGAAMHIGERQVEFEILPEEPLPSVLPEPVEPRPSVLPDEARPG
jgi:hypothetical protein